MHVSLPNNKPEEGMNCLTDSLSQLSLGIEKGIEKSLAKISLDDTEEGEEKVKDDEEKKEDETDCKIEKTDEEEKREKEDETDCKIEKTDEEEKREKDGIVEEDRKSKTENEEKGEENEKDEDEEEEEEEKIEKKGKEDKEICLEDSNKREEKFDESEEVVAKDDDFLKTKEEEEASQLTITSRPIPKDEKEDVDKPDSKKAENREEEEHSSDEDSSDDEEETEEKEKNKAPEKTSKYRSRGIEDASFPYYTGTNDYTPYTHDFSPPPCYVQPTQPQFQRSPQYGQSPGYSGMSPSYIGMGVTNERTSYVTEDPWPTSPAPTYPISPAYSYPISPAPSSTDGNDSNQSYNDLSSGMINNNLSQWNDQYGHCGTQESGVPVIFNQLASSHGQTQPLVPEQYEPLQPEESRSPMFYDNSCSPQHQSNNLFTDYASLKPTIIESQHANNYSQDIDLTFKATLQVLKNEVENPSQRHLTEADKAKVAIIKRSLLENIGEFPQESPATSPPAACPPAASPPAPSLPVFQPSELPDSTWQMTWNDEIYMQHYRRTVSWSNSDVTNIDNDGDTPCMVVACKPAETAGYVEKFKAVMMRQKNVNMCCNKPIEPMEGVCQICRNSNKHSFHSSLSIRNKQGHTVLSSVVLMRQPVSVIEFVLENLRQADLPNVFTPDMANFYSTYAQIYPVLHRYLYSY